MHHIKRIGAAAVLAGLMAFYPVLADARTAAPTPQWAVGAQYGTTHVYVAAEDMDRFTASFLGTFGGKSSQPAAVTVTPTPSSTNGRRLQRR